MNQVIGYYAAHDANITVYQPHKDKFFTLELERLEKIKHFRPVDINPQAELVDEWIVENERIYQQVLKIFEKYNIDNQFSTMTWRSRGDVHNFGQTTFNFVKSLDADCYHHEAHTWSAYMQSPFDTALVLSYDGGGDGTCFQVSKIVNGKIVEVDKQPFEYGPLFIKLLGKYEIYRNTPPLDIAGKAMGLSAYGKVDQSLFPLLDSLSKTVYTNDIHKRWNDLQSTDCSMTHIFDYKSYCDQYDVATIESITNNISVEDLAATIQAYIEETVINLVKTKYKQQIEQCDGNLIITGGVALNVLVNQKIKQVFPNINIFVPPNPHDGGLSVGMVYKHLIDAGHIEPGSKYNLDNSGPELFDIDNLSTHLKNNKHEIISINDIVNLLKNGKILGFLQGHMEIGPRALGNRSILCDASYPNMKDIINAKVKFREHYRPFAPMCLKENASKYFDAPNFDNTEYMSYTVNVKDGYKEILKSITHVDGTARLQTVTKSSNPLMYKILSIFDGVLLNTSFNIQGQPILNTLEDAAINLANTQLDGYVLYHNEEFYHFYK